MGEHKLSAPAPQSKPAPPRNELKKVELSRNSRAHELSDRDPGFHYESFSTDPRHPAYIGKKLRRHEIGDESIGFAMCEPWEIVQDVTDAKVKALDPRTDQGKGVDTTLRYGLQITARTPLSEKAKYDAVHRARIEQRRQSLFGSPDRLRGRGTAMTSLTSNEADADPTDLLKQAAHPFPG